MAGEVLAHVQGESLKANAAVSGGFLAPRPPAALVVVHLGSLEDGTALQLLGGLPFEVPYGV
jgi:hypothetical protein